MRLSSLPEMNRAGHASGLVVDVGVVLAGVDVGQHALPEDVARRRDVVALVQFAARSSVNVLVNAGVPLLEREADGLVSLAGFLAPGASPSPATAAPAYAFGRRGIDCHAGRAVAAIHE